MANTWAYGFDPNMCWVGFMPNWADTVRVCTCGTVSSILVDGRSLLDAFVAQEVLKLEAVTPDILISEWEKVDTEGMKKLINDHKVKVVCAVCPPSSCRPAGSGRTSARTALCSLAPASLSFCIRLHTKIPTPGSRTCATGAIKAARRQIEGYREVDRLSSSVRCPYCT